MNWAKIGIISCVPPAIFANNKFDTNIFSDSEITSAKKEEIRVFLDLLDKEYEDAVKKQWISFELIRAMEWLPANKSHDAYIIGGSPAMVTDKLPWIDDLKKFINTQVNNQTPVLWICFWHQILASSFWSEVDFMPWRKLWKGSVLLNAKWKGDEIFSQIDNNFETLWSHKQALLKPSDELTVIWGAEHDKNAVIKVWEHAWGMQFHPEFTVDFVQFLRKIMDSSLRNEGLSPEDIWSQLKSMASNEGSKIVQLFLKKYWNK